MIKFDVAAPIVLTIVFPCSQASSCYKQEDRECTDNKSKIDSMKHLASYEDDGSVITLAYDAPNDDYGYGEHNDGEHVLWRALGRPKIIGCILSTRTMQL